MAWTISIVAIVTSVAVLAYAALRLRPAVNGLRRTIEAQAREIEAASKKADAAEGWRNDERRLSRGLESAQNALSRVETSLNSTARKTSEAVSLLKSDERRLSLAQERTAELTTTLSQKVRSFEESSKSLARRIDEVAAEAARASTNAEAVRNAIAKNPSANAAHALTHARIASDGAIAEFVGELGPKLGVALTERQLYHMAHRACMIESACHGRLATSIDAMLARLIAAAHLTKDPGVDFRFVEIGTLYGVGALAIFDFVRFRASKAHVVIIDPLDGYYERGSSDFVSASPVSRAVLEENWRVVAGDAHELTVIQAKSESGEALDATAGQLIDLLIIDGDHSYKGVKRDFENYFPRVRTGGIIVVDDYDVPEWPEIKKFADGELAPRADLQRLHAKHRTLLLRKI